jgi:hypothetical protein
MADDLVGGSFDPVGVVAGAFEDSGAGAVAALRVEVAQDFLFGLGDRLGQVLRGEWPPGR